MKEKQQDKAAEAKDVSPLVRDKTYGERMYQHVFGQFLNFGVNLLTSAAFSLWAASSRKQIRLPLVMNHAETPRDIQTRMAVWLEGSKPVQWILRNEPSHDARLKRAHAITEVFTLLIPGHFIMIPSVWFGAKVKPAFVRWFDRRHYGENAEADPSIAYRHELIDAEAKPTLLGATVGRFGTAALTTTTSLLIGSEKNMLNKVPGLEKFPGVNPMAAQLGEVIGGSAAREIPALSRWNDKLSAGLTWSAKQEERNLHLMPDLKNKRTYNQGIQDYVGFTSMDTLYTLITATAIKPILSMLRHVPGMTYSTHAPVEKRIVTETGDTTKLRVPKNRMALAPQAEAAPQVHTAADTPKINVSDIQHMERIHTKQQEVSAG